MTIEFSSETTYRLARCALAASNDPQRQNLHHVVIFPDGLIAATDGKIVALSRVANQCETAFIPPGDPILIPASLFNSAKLWRPKVDKRDAGQLAEPEFPRLLFSVDLDAGKATLGPAGGPWTTAEASIGSYPNVRGVFPRHPQQCAKAVTINPEQQIIAARILAVQPGYLGRPWSDGPGKAQFYASKSGHCLVGLSPLILTGEGVDKLPAAFAFVLGSPAPVESAPAA